MYRKDLIHEYIVRVRPVKSLVQHLTSQIDRLATVELNTAYKSHGHYGVLNKLSDKDKREYVTKYARLSDDELLSYIQEASDEEIINLVTYMGQRHDELLPYVDYGDEFRREDLDSPDIERSLLMQMFV